MLGISQLRNPVRAYAWGSRSAIAELQGRPVPSLEPEAELWMGDHPLAPSEVREGEVWIPLPELIRERGDEVLGAGRERLPFLLKVLAAERPLSIQAHPDREQARRGFAREESYALARDAEGRSYPDASAKPEILYALTPFRMLRGLRRPAEVLARLESAGIRGEVGHAAFLEAREESEGLRRFLAAHLVWPDREAALERIVGRLGRAVEEGHDREGLAALVLSLAAEYPGDPGILAPYFLHTLALEPGQAVFTGAGILHAYLHGVGVELMANSDNVLRGGLTRKYVDVGELLRILRFEAQPPSLLPVRRTGGEELHESPSGELRLSLLEPGGEGSIRLAAGGGAEILFCAAGGCELRAVGGRERDSPIRVRRGEAFLVPASVRAFEVAGRGRLFRARAEAAG